MNEDKNFEETKNEELCDTQPACESESCVSECERVTGNTDELLDSEAPNGYYQFNAVQPAQPSEQSGFKREKKRGNGIGLAAIIACMVVVMLVGGVIGGIIGNKMSAGGNETAGGSKTPSASKVPNATDDGINPSEGVVYGNGTTSGTMSEVTNKCKSSVVSIYVKIVSNSYYYGENVTTSSGSGVIVTEDGYIVTCNHVVEGATSMTVNLQDGTEYEATLVGYDARTDLAVIKIDATGLAAATVGTSESYEVGDEVYAVGNPLGEFESTITSGIISGFNRNVEIDGTTMTLMQTDAAINPGNSGGGLFSKETGELLGIVNAKSYGVEIEGIGFAIPTETVKAIATDLMDLGYVSGRPYIGISMQDSTISDGTGGGFFGFGGSYREIVLITYVAENSPAAMAGLKVGDYIVKFEDTEITTTEGFRGALNNYNAGDEVKLTVQRENQTVEVTLTLGESSGNNG